MDRLGQARDRARARGLGRLGQLERGDRDPAAPRLHGLRSAQPATGLAYDSATIADFLHTISGPIVLAGHSYGGAVITNAATGDRQVKALVYDDAFVPAQGDTLVELTKPGSCFAVQAAKVFNFVPYPGAPSGAADTYVKQTCSPAASPTACLPPRQRCWPLPSGPYPAARLWEVGGPGLEDHPVLGRGRHGRPRHHAGRAAVHGPTGARSHHQINAPHLSMITNPGVVAGVIIHAAQATG